MSWPDLSLGPTGAWQPPRTGDQGIEWEGTSSRVEAVVPEPRRGLPSLTGLWCWGGPQSHYPGGQEEEDAHGAVLHWLSSTQHTPRDHPGLSFPQTNTCHTSHFTPNLGLHGF